MRFYFFEIENVHCGINFNVSCEMVFVVFKNVLCDHTLKILINYKLIHGFIKKKKQIQITLFHI